MVDLHSPTMDQLFRAIMSLDSLEECYAFFEDVCTIREIQDMAQRFDVAVMLEKGYSCQRISEETNISTATICRVRKCLNYGDGGYLNAIEKLKLAEKRSK